MRQLYGKKWDDAMGGYGSPEFKSWCQKFEYAKSEHLRFALERIEDKGYLNPPPLATFNKYVRLAAKESCLDSGEAVNDKTAEHYEQVTGKKFNLADYRDQYTCTKTGTLLGEDWIESCRSGKADCKAWRRRVEIMGETA
jgi:hypothetical protein